MTTLRVASTRNKFIRLFVTQKVTFHLKEFVEQYCYCRYYRTAALGLFIAFVQEHDTFVIVDDRGDILETKKFLELMGVTV